MLPGKVIRDIIFYPTQLSTIILLCAYPYSDNAMTITRIYYIYSVRRAIIMIDQKSNKRYNKR